jgi:hypothetical protein
MALMILCLATREARAANPLPTLPPSYASLHVSRDSVGASVLETSTYQDATSQTIMLEATDAKQVVTVLREWGGTSLTQSTVVDRNDRTGSLSCRSFTETGDAFVAPTVFFDGTDGRTCFTAYLGRGVSTTPWVAPSALTLPGYSLTYTGTSTTDLVDSWETGCDWTSTEPIGAAVCDWHEIVGMEFWLLDNADRVPKRFNYSTTREEPDGHGGFLSTGDWSRSVEYTTFVPGQPLPAVLNLGLSCILSIL